MSDISETTDRYNAICKEEDVPPSELVMAVLKKEAEICAHGVANFSSNIKMDMYFYLAGNNTLINNARRLVDQDALILFKTLRNNIYVTALDLRYNNLTDVGAQHIAALIQETPTIKELNLMCNDIEEEGAKHIANALLNNETIQSIHMNGNKIGNMGGMYFAQMLQVNATLESLDLGDTDLKTQSVIALATVLTHNTTLKSLNVNRPLLFSHQEETTVHYAGMLKCNSTLEELHLAKHDMRDFGVTRLAESLIDNICLTHLNLSCNRITRDGTKEIAKLLKKDTKLRVLDLSYNRLEDDGALHLAEALATYNTTLEVLAVTSNCIAGKGLCAIADCLRMNSSLSNLYIWGNKLEESACIAFASLIETGRLETKNTDVQPYVVDGVTKLSELSHGVQKWYYWGPSYGPQANPHLAQFSLPVSAVAQ